MHKIEVDYSQYSKCHYCKERDAKIENEYVTTLYKVTKTNFLTKG